MLQYWDLLPGAICVSWCHRSLGLVGLVFQIVLLIPDPRDTVSTDRMGVREGRRIGSQ